MYDELEGLRWDDIPLLSIDTETTGFSREDKICDIALVLLRDDEPIDVYKALINPGIPIPEEVTEIHGITDTMVRNAPHWHEVQDDVMSFLLRGVPWVAHNMDFDARMLYQEIGPEDFPRGVITLCTQVMARRLLKGKVRNNKLGTLAEYYGFEQQREHEAYEDALVCGLIARQLMTGAEVLRTYTKLSDDYLK